MTEETNDMFPMLADGRGAASSVEEYVRRAMALSFQEAAKNLLEPKRHYDDMIHPSTLFGDTVTVNLFRSGANHAVRLVHTPTGIVIDANADVSIAENVTLATRALVQRLASLVPPPPPPPQSPDGQLDHDLDLDQETTQ